MYPKVQKFSLLYQFCESKKVLRKIFYYFKLDTYDTLRMAHTDVPQVTYTSRTIQPYTAALYSNPQSSSRIVSYQPAPTSYYDLITSQNQQQQQQEHQQLLETHSPKIECPSPPCSTGVRSPGMVSQSQSPDHHQLASPHIVTLGSPSTSPAGSKIMLDNGHLERPTVVSISS